MRKKERKAIKLSRTIVQRPPDTSFIRVLHDWECLRLEARMSDGSIWSKVFILSPKLLVYRYAELWEKPTLVIDSNILPPEHHIRLIRIRETKTITIVKKAFLRQQKRMTRANHRH